MATTIKIKNSATSGGSPSSLQQGEFAINVTDGRLFYGSGSGNTVKEFTGASIDTGSFVTTSSFNSFTSSIQTEVDNLTLQTGSYAITGSNTFIGNQIISGNVEIIGAITASVLSSSYIDLDVLANGDIPAHKAGRIFFGAEDGALEVYNEEADITLQVGQEFWIRVYNPTASPIANGTPVRASGSQGDRIRIYPAVAEDHTAQSVFENHILGLATHEIEAGTEGYVTSQGIVRGVNTSAFSAGDILFLQTSSAGFRNTPPPFPYDIVQVGYVARSASPNGFIFVQPKEPVHFNVISGLSGSSLAEPGDLFIYQTNNAWTPSKTLSGSYIIDNGNLNVDGNITASGDISASGKFSGKIGNFEYDTAALSGAGSFSGNIIKTGTTATAAGRLYYLNTSGGWTGAGASSTSTSTSLLAVAVGANSSVNGMVLTGLVVVALDPGGNPGDALYIDTNTFRITATAPTGSGNVVRKVGHKLSATRIYFNPSLDHIVIS